MQSANFWLNYNIVFCNLAGTKSSRMALEGRNSAIHDPDEKPDNFQVLAVRLTEFGGYDKIKVLTLSIISKHKYNYTKQIFFFF